MATDWDAPPFRQEPEPEFRDPKLAFNEAIESGRLSINPASSLFAGLFMYMGTWNGVDSFKNKLTRQYIPDTPGERTQEGNS